MVIKGPSSLVLLSDDFTAGRAIGQATLEKETFKDYTILYTAQGLGQIKLDCN